MSILGSFIFALSEIRLNYLDVGFYLLIFIFGDVVAIPLGVLSGFILMRYFETKGEEVNKSQVLIISLILGVALALLLLFSILLISSGKGYYHLYFIRFIKFLVIATALSYYGIGKLMRSLGIKILA
jgi:hypothetical protein